MSMSSDLWAVRKAIECLPESCRYHGRDFGRLGYEGPNGEPRCESCRPAWRRMCGLAAVDRMRDEGGRERSPATGGVIDSSQVYLVGENGPPALVLPAAQRRERSEPSKGSEPVTLDDLGPYSGDCCDGRSGTPFVDCNCTWRRSLTEDTP